MLTYEELWDEVEGLIREQMELLKKIMITFATKNMFPGYGIGDVLSIQMKTGGHRAEDWVYFYVSVSEDHSKSVMCNFDLSYKEPWPTIKGGIVSRFYIEFDGKTLYSYDSGDVDWRTDPKGLKKWVKELVARRRKEIMKAILNVAGPEWQNLWV